MSDKSNANENNKKDENNHGYPQRINICMIGPSGVGKTSLLATMYKTLQSSLGGKFRFEPLNKDAFIILKDKYTSLQKMVDKPACTRVVNTDTGTPFIQEYLFGLDYVADNGKKTNLTLVNFFDTPGAMTSRMDEELESRIRESHIIINAIDAGVMMKADKLNAEQYNGYSDVQRLLDTCAFSDEDNKLVIFTMIKAETWIMDRGNPKHVEADVNYLLRKFGEHCQCLVDLFPESAARLGIFCPVETLGCVEFSMVTKDERGDQLVHYKKTVGKKFSPRHVQLPLYFALRFALAEWCNNKGFFGKLYAKYFGVYDEVLSALGAMDAEAIESIVNAPIEPLLYGNQGLLRVK